MMKAGLGQHAMKKIVTVVIMVCAKRGLAYAFQVSLETNASLHNVQIFAISTEFVQKRVNVSASQDITVTHATS